MRWPWLTGGGPVAKKKVLKEGDHLTSLMVRRLEVLVVWRNDARVKRFRRMHILKQATPLLHSKRETVRLYTPRP